MNELFHYAILPALAVGIGYMVVVVAAGWIGYRYFGYLPKEYEDRLRLQGNLTKDLHVGAPTSRLGRTS